MRASYSVWTYSLWIFGGTLALSLFLFFDPVQEGLLFAASVVETKKATIIFGGDMLFDRSIRTAVEREGGEYLFSCLWPTLRNADLVVANLEGPITDNTSVSVGSAVGSPENYRFTFPPSTAELLYEHNIRLVNLGNNHIQNFGLGGVASTIQYLSLARVGYFGDPLLYTMAFQTIHDVRLAFVTFNEFDTTLSFEQKRLQAISQITLAKNEGYMPILFAHWGDEYMLQAPLRIHMLARELVDAGAALVVGSHPHVVEQSEIYNGTYIYYSLGNFIFDQYFSPEVMQGLLLEVVFTPQTVLSLKEIPITLSRDRRTCPIEPVFSL